jgi:hypothetical protein
MLHAPHPDLNEEERALLPDAPEQSLRRAVKRGALSLDHVMEKLSPLAEPPTRRSVTSPTGSMAPSSSLARVYLCAGRPLGAIEHYEALQAILPAGLRAPFERVS